MGKINFLCKTLRELYEPTMVPSDTAWYFYYYRDGEEHVLRYSMNLHTYDAACKKFNRFLIDNYH